MPINEDDKLEIIDQLENTRTKGSRLVISLKFAGKMDDADKAQHKIRVLGSQIDDLLAKSMKAWSGNGKALIEDMKKTNQTIQKDINDVKKMKDIANSAVKALGNLDLMIDVAKELISNIK